MIDKFGLNRVQVLLYAECMR